MKMSDEIVYSENLRLNEENILVNLYGSLFVGKKYPLGKIIMYYLEEIGLSIKREKEILAQWRKKQYKKNHNKIPLSALKNVFNEKKKEGIKVFRFYFNQLDMVEQLVICKYAIEKIDSHVLAKKLGFFSNLWDFIPDGDIYWNKDINKYIGILLKKHGLLYDWEQVLYGIPEIKKVLVKKDIDERMSNILNNKNIGLINGMAKWVDVYYLMRTICEELEKCVDSIVNDNVWEEVINNLKKGNEIPEIEKFITFALCANIEKTVNFIRKIKERVENEIRCENIENYVKVLGVGINELEKYSFIKKTEDILNINIKDVLRETEKGMVINLEKLLVNDFLKDIQNLNDLRMSFHYGLKIKNSENKKRVEFIRKELKEWKNSKKKMEGKYECDSLISVDKNLIKEIVDVGLLEKRKNLEKRVTDILTEIGLCGLLDSLVKENKMTYEIKFLSNGEMSYLGIELLFKEEDRVLVKEVVNEILVYQWGDDKSKNISEMEIKIDEKWMRSTLPEKKETPLSLLKF